MSCGELASFCNKNAFIYKFFNNGLYHSVIVTAPPPLFLRALFSFLYIGILVDNIIDGYILIMQIAVDHFLNIIAFEFLHLIFEDKKGFKPTTV